MSPIDNVATYTYAHAARARTSTSRSRAALDHDRSHASSQSSRSSDCGKIPPKHDDDTIIIHCVRCTQSDYGDIKHSTHFWEAGFATKIGGPSDNFWSDPSISTLSKRARGLCSRAHQEREQARRSRNRIHIYWRQLSDDPRGVSLEGRIGHVSMLGEFARWRARRPPNTNSAFHQLVVHVSHLSAGAFKCYKTCRR